MSFFCEYVSFGLMFHLTAPLPLLFSTIYAVYTKRRSAATGLSSYSLSESTLKIEKLVNLAKKNNMPALAITDNNNMFGVFEFAQECINNNIQPIIGTSINLSANVIIKEPTT